MVKVDGTFVLDYHVEGNIAQTSVFLNLLKNAYPVIIFRAISAFRGAESESDYRRAMRGMVNLRILDCAFGKRLEKLKSGAGKLTTQAVKDQIDEMHKSWTTGVLSASALREIRKDYGKEVFGLPRLPRRQKCSFLSPPEMKYRWAQFRQIADGAGFGGEANEHLWTMQNKKGYSVFFPFSELAKEMIADVWDDSACERWFRHRCLKLRGSGMNPTLFRFAYLHGILVT